MAPSHRRAAAALALALAAAVFAGEGATFADARPSSGGGAPPPPTPCKYTPGTNITSPSCAQNPAWVITLPKKFAKTVSVVARIDLEVAKATAACAAYNVSTAEAKAACRADRANRCFVSPSGTTCGSGMDSYVKAKEWFCPGSAYQKAIWCQAQFRDECEKVEGCAWSDLMWYGGKASMDANKAKVEASMGGPPAFGGCNPKEYIAAGIDAYGNYSAAALNAWSLANLGNANNATDWYAKRGTCDYAVKGMTRNAYSRACSIVNVPFEGGRYLGLNSTDMASLQACRTAGCDVEWVDTSYLINRGFTFYPKAGYLRCVTNFVYINTQLSYNTTTDGQFLQAGIICNNPALTFSRERCEAIRV